MIKIIQLLSTFSVVVPFITGLTFVNHLQGIRLSAWALCVAALFPQLIRYITNEQHIENVLYNSYTFLEFTMMMNLLFKLAQGKDRIIFFTLILGFVIFSVWLYHENDIRSRFIYELACYDNLSYTLLILLIIYQQMDQDTFILQTSNDAFWFILSILVYAPITVFTLLLWKQMHENSTSMFIRTAMIVNDVSNIVLYAGFTVGLLSNHTKQQQLVR